MDMCLEDMEHYFCVFNFFIFIWEIKLVILVRVYLNLRPVMTAGEDSIILGSNMEVSASIKT